jgi:hypothetical protein
MAEHAHAASESVSHGNSLTPILTRLGRSKGAVSPAISTGTLTGAIVTKSVATIPSTESFLDARTAKASITTSVDGLGGPLVPRPVVYTVKACQIYLHAFKSVFSLHKTQVQTLYGLS